MCETLLSFFIAIYLSPVSCCGYFLSRASEVVLNGRCWLLYMYGVQTQKHSQWTDWLLYQYGVEAQKHSEWMVLTALPVWG